MPREANSERQDYDDETAAIGDEDESSDGRQAQPAGPHPLESLTKAELESRLKSDPGSLGAASLGRPNAGRLLNAVQLPEDSHWKRVDPAHAWATPETVEYLSRALRAVAERYTGTSPVSIGHLSARNGGPLRPHVSHQSGRDVDVGFYYSNGSSQWYQRASDDNLDLDRTWWLIRTLVLETDIEMILLDQGLSRLVERFALENGESREWVDGLFHSRQGRPPIVRHAAGHATHLHLRFFNPIAQETGRLLMPLMVERKMVAPPQRLVTHVARSGDTLAKLAARYSTTMQAIREANSMKTYQLVAGASYRIPVPGRAEGGSRMKLPARRVHSKAANQGN
ncbi:MAG TPA: penicillin-insensitive murein endopeptidase [Polyangiaceae bacterium]|nr:penicillin-insensitive murein endopeptidase [Polyangiaceae bacterium]